MGTVVFITTQFEGFHRWKDAPDKWAYLRDWHRHIFHVRLEIPVEHNNRDIEFIDLKARVHDYLCGWTNRFELSCEQIAGDLLAKFSASRVEVSEDGENGAVVAGEPDCPQPHKKTRCFTGIEAEGPWRGEATLFIPGSTSPAEARKAVAATTTIKRLYYGAGNDRDIRADTLRELLATKRLLTIEVDEQSLSTAYSLMRSDVTVVSTSPVDYEQVDYIKIIAGGWIHWIGHSKSYSTPVADPLFLQDKDL